MNIIGRKREQDILEACLNSGRPEFLALYGRRRVGKTYLVTEYFKHNFAFYTSGVHGLNNREQLKNFHRSLNEYNSPYKTIPKDWFEAFARLKELILNPSVPKDPVSGKIIVFIDELPWMDAPRSDFKSALDFFWNSFGASQPKLLFIVCGSATSWIIRNLLNSTGGFHNRITRQINMQPFDIRECSELFAAGGMVMSVKEQLQSYMIFGGIPYYLNCMDRRLSFAQNVDELLFKESGQLHFEYDRLYSSLFNNSEKHEAIVRELSKKHIGLTRVEISKNKKIGDGEALTKALSELEQCGFIRKYKTTHKQKQGFLYQLTDPFALFHINFLENQSVESWVSHIDTPGYYSWCGLSFEMVCFLHLDLIKEALGIQGVETISYTWSSRGKDKGSQIDLIIDRRDDVINLCEIKYSNAPFIIDAEYEKKLLSKIEIFRNETGTKKAIHLTFITSNGLEHNSHSGIVIREINASDWIRQT